MCFGGGNNSAQALAAQQQAEMRRQEEERQGKIREGQAGIDKAFSQFDPAYYDKFKQTYNANYLPQIEDQYARAKDKLTATLAGRGTLESTVGASKFGDLQKTRNDAEAQVGNSGADAANDLRKRVEDTKSNLYTLNQSAADPAGVSARAIGEASSIATPPSLSPIGQVFASVLQPLATFNKADATSMNPRLPWNANGYAPLAGRGSATYA
jgi:hypothetical protein